MRFRAIVKSGDDTESLDYDLDLRPATLESARTYIQAQVDEGNRKKSNLNARRTLVSVELIESYHPRKKAV